MSKPFSNDLAAVPEDGDVQLTTVTVVKREIPDDHPKHPSAQGVGNKTARRLSLSDIRVKVKADGCTSRAKAAWQKAVKNFASADAEPLGRNVFTMFPLPEIRSIKESRKNAYFNKVLVCELIAVIALVLLGGWLYFATSRFVAPVMLANNSIPLLIRTEGCHVNFRKLQNTPAGKSVKNVSTVVTAKSGDNVTLAAPERVEGTFFNFISDSSQQALGIFGSIRSTLESLVGEPNDCEYLMAGKRDKNDALYGNSYYCVDWTYNTRRWLDQTQTSTGRSFVKIGSALQTDQRSNPFQLNRNVGIVYTSREDLRTANGTELPNLEIVASGEVSDSYSDCEVTVWTFNPLTEVTIVSTVHPVEVRKIDKIDPSQEEQKIRPRWQLNIAKFAVNGTNLNLAMTNLAVSSVKILTETGNVKLDGLSLNPAFRNITNTIQTGVDLGSRIDVGSHASTNVSECISGGKQCGGNIHVAVGTSARVLYSQNEGVVCAAARNVEVESSSCTAPSNNASHAANATINETAVTPNNNELVSGTCEGQLVLCSSDACDSSLVPLLSLNALHGGVYTSSINYKFTSSNMQNDRSTVDGRSCRFPFVHKGRTYHDCTTEGKGELEWCKVDRDDASTNSLCDFEKTYATNHSNCSASNEAEDWGFCLPYQTFQGFAYDSKSIRFNKEGFENIKSIKGFENQALNSPIITSLTMQSKSMSLGQSMWVYTTRSPFMLIRNDYLSLYSAGLVSARTKPQSNVRQMPGFCPVEAFPDAILSTQQMGSVHSAIHEATNGAATSVLGWFAELETDPVLRASGTATSGVSFNPADWYESGIVLFERAGNGVYHTFDATALLGNTPARAAVWLTYILYILYFLFGLFIVVPSGFRVVSQEYEKYIRHRRRLCLTEQRLKLEKQIKRREKEFGPSSDNERPKVFWRDSDGNDIEYFEDAVADLSRKMDNLLVESDQWTGRGLVCPAGKGRECNGKVNKKTGKRETHGLGEYKAPDSTTLRFLCDICEEDIERGTIVHGCEICDFDMCENCWRQREGYRTVETKEFLKKVFKRADAGIISFLAAKAVTKVYKQNATIIKQGNIGDRFYVLRSGSVTVFCSSNDRIIEIGELLASPGSFEIKDRVFGEGALLDSYDNTRNATVRATSEVVEVLVFDKRCFDSVSDSVRNAHKQRERERETKMVTKHTWAQRFCLSCCTRRNPNEVTAARVSKLAKLRREFQAISTIRTKYRTTLERHLEYFVHGVKQNWHIKKEKEREGFFWKKNKTVKEMELEENHTRTVLAIFPGIEDETLAGEETQKKMSAPEQRFEALWVDIEELFSNKMITENGCISGYNAAAEIIHLVRMYCNIEDKKMKDMNEGFELCDRVWVAHARDQSEYVQPLNIWEFADVVYHIFVAPLFKNSVQLFLRDEIKYEQEIKNEWYWQQNMLVQYAIGVCYYLEKLGGSKRKFLQYEYVPPVDGITLPQGDDDDDDDDFLDDREDEEEEDDDGSDHEPSYTSEEEDFTSSEDDEYTSDEVDDSDQYDSYGDSESEDELEVDETMVFVDAESRATINICNPSEFPRDMSGWAIVYSSEEHATTTFTLPNDTMIGPHDKLTIFANQDKCDEVSNNAVEALYKPLLLTGELFQKHPGSGGSMDGRKLGGNKLKIGVSPRYVCLTPRLDEIMWAHPTSRTTAKGTIPIATITDVQKGQQSAAFARTGISPELEQRCFSIVSKSRTLDLEAVSMSQRDSWAQAVSEYTKFFNDEQKENETDVFSLVWKGNEDETVYPILNDTSSHKIMLLDPNNDFVSSCSENDGVYKIEKHKKTKDAMRLAAAKAAKAADELKKKFERIKGMKIGEAKEAAFKLAAAGAEMAKQALANPEEAKKKLQEAAEREAAEAKRKLQEAAEKKKAEAEAKLKKFSFFSGKKKPKAEPKANEPKANEPKADEPKADGSQKDDPPVVTLESSLSTQSIEIEVTVPRESKTLMRDKFADRTVKDSAPNVLFTNLSMTEEWVKLRNFGGDMNMSGYTLNAASTYTFRNGFLLKSGASLTLYCAPGKYQVDTAAELREKEKQNLQNNVVLLWRNDKGKLQDEDVLYGASDVVLQDEKGNDIHRIVGGIIASDEESSSSDSSDSSAEEEKIEEENTQSEEPEKETEGRLLSLRRRVTDTIRKFKRRRQLKKRRKQSYLRLHSFPPVPMKIWKLGKHKHLGQRVANVQRAGKTRLELLVDRYTSYCDTKGLARVETDELVARLQDQHEIEYDKRTSTFAKIRFQKRDGEDHGSDPWPKLTPIKIFLWFLFFFLIVPNLVFFPLFYLAVRFRAVGTSMIVVIVRELALVLPIVLLAIVVFATLEPLRQFKDSSAIFGVREFIYEPHKLYDYAGDQTMHHPLFYLSAIIMGIYFAIGNLDLVYYYLFGDSSTSMFGESSGAYKKGDWVVLKPSNSTRSFFNVWWPTSLQNYLRDQAYQKLRTHHNFPTKYAAINVWINGARYSGIVADKPDTSTCVVKKDEHGKMVFVAEEQKPNKKDKTKLMKVATASVLFIDPESPDTYGKKIKLTLSSQVVAGKQDKSRGETGKFEEALEEGPVKWCYFCDFQRGHNKHEVVIPPCVESKDYKLLKTAAQASKTKYDLVVKDADSKIKRLKDKAEEQKQKLEEQKSEEGRGRGESFWSFEPQIFSDDEAGSQKRRDYRKVFDEADVNESGTIDIDEFKYLVNSKMLLNMTDDRCEEIFKHFDVDVDGKSKNLLGFNEFVNALDMLLNEKRKENAKDELHDLVNCWRAVTEVKMKVKKKETIDKDHIYRISKVNITTSGKIKDYRLVPVEFNPFLPESLVVYSAPFKRLQKVQRPRVCGMMHTMVHALFLVLLNIILSLVLAYVCMVASWWVLGAVIQPERTLAFASTILVLVGSVKAMFANFRNTKQALEKKLETAVTDFVAGVLDQVISPGNKSGSIVSLPKLPSAMAGLNMSAAELYTNLQSEDGVVAVMNSAIDQLVTKAAGSAAKDDKRLTYVKDFLLCLAKSEKQEQRKAFQSLAARVISEGSATSQNIEPSPLSELLGKLCFATDGIDARNRIEEASNQVQTIMGERNINGCQRGFALFGSWFVKVLSDDMKILGTHVQRVLDLWKGTLGSITTRKVSLSAPSSFDSYAEEVCMGSVLVLTAKMLESVFFRLVKAQLEKYPSEEGKFKNSGVPMFNVNLLQTCDGSFIKLFRLLEQSKGKRTPEVLRCIEQIFNTLFDHVLMALNVNHKEVIKCIKDQFRPLVSRMLKVGVAIWFRLFYSSSSVDRTKLREDMSSIIKEHLKICRQSISSGDKAPRNLRNVLSVAEAQFEDDESPELKTPEGIPRFLPYFVLWMFLYEELENSDDGSLREFFFGGSKSSRMIDEVEEFLSLKHNGKTVSLRSILKGKAETTQDELNDIDTNITNITERLEGAHGDQLKEGNYEKEMLELDRKKIEKEHKKYSNFWEYCFEDMKSEYKALAKAKFGELLKTHLRNVYDLAGGASAFSKLKYASLFEKHQNKGLIDFDGFQNAARECGIVDISAREYFETDSKNDQAFNAVMKKLEEDVSNWRHTMDQKNEQRIARFANVIDVVKELSKMHTTKEGLPSILNRMANDLIELCFDNNPQRKTQVFQVYTNGTKLLRVLAKMRAGKVQPKEGSSKDKYKALFKTVDISGDGQVDFNEFVVLVNTRLGLYLSTQKCKLLFSESDKNGSGTLYFKEFEYAMRLLEKEITYASLRKVGLTPETMYPAIAGVVLWLVCILVFVLMGFSAFAEGTAFGAGIGAVLPMIAGNSAKLKDSVSRIDTTALVERTMKEDFQQASTKRK